MRRGFCFVVLLLQYIENSLLEYCEGTNIVGRGSANKVPFLYVVKYDVDSGSFSISTSSPGATTSPQFERAEVIKSVLGNRIMAVISFIDNKAIEEIENHCGTIGIEPALKLYASQTEYLAFIDEMTAKNESVFLKPLDKK